ncbi:hypothetical protein [Mycobacterium sp.]|uniref:hypothetical protein n=1 Tax=Mycobacterium sp. TaxID=1785 RepID=UPI001273FDC7|nr:hypothetical protein [Mycobacterium sp.]KAA8966903.1 MAG: hypothetical protein F6Q13_07010 [Mycobacterium sp.]
MGVDGVARNIGRTVARAATVTTAAAGAVGGATVDGIIGGVAGTVAGVQRGISKGSRSTPAAALTFGALGIAGLVEWPVLLAVGGGVLLLRQLSLRRDGPAARSNSAPTESAPSMQSGARRSAPAKQAAARPPRGSQSSGRR